MPSRSRGTAVLISPPLSAEEQAGSMRNIANVIPPLGIAYVAAAAEDKGFDVKIIDAPHGRLDIERTVELCEEYHPDIIGISATILTIFTAQQLSNGLKQRVPGARIVLSCCRGYRHPEPLREAHRWVTELGRQVCDGSPLSETGGDRPC